MLVDKAPGALFTIVYEFTVNGNAPSTETLRSEKLLPFALESYSPNKTVSHISIGLWKCVYSVMKIVVCGSVAGNSIVFILNAYLSKLNLN